MSAPSAADSTRGAAKAGSDAKGGARTGPASPPADAPHGDESLNRVALRTALTYAVAGAVWIAFSDGLIALLVTDRETAAKISMLKGWMFVGVTAVLLYVVLGGQLRRWKSEAAGRRRAAQTLATSEAQLANALTMAHAGHWEYDVATNLYTFNDHFYRVLRTTAEREGGYTMTPARYSERFLPPEKASLVGAGVRKAMEATDPHFTDELEHPVIFGDGTPGDLAVRAFIVKDGEGRTIKTHGVNQDITQRKRAGQALRESQALYRSLVDNIPAGVFRKDAAGRYVFVNERFCRVEGFPPEKFLGRTSREVADDLAKLGGAAVHDWHQTIRQVHHGADHHKLIMQTGRPIEMEEEWVAVDGSRRFFQAVKTPVFGAEGTSIGSQGVLFEITERKQAEAALRASEEHLQLASRVGGVGTFEYNPLTGETRASKVLQEMDELGGNENRFATLVERMQPEDRAGFLAASQRADDPAGDGRFEYEHRLRRPDGSIRWMCVQSQTWCEGEGAARHPVRTVGTVIDITERRQAEAALRESQALYSALVEQMPVGVFRKDTAGRYVFVNSWFCSLWGSAPEFFLGRTAQEFGAALAQRGVAGFDAGTEVALANRGAGHHAAIMQTGQRIEVEDERVRQDGERQYFHAVKTPVFDANGTIIGSQGVLIDITARRHAERALRTVSRAIEHSPVSIIITDAAGAIEYVNPKFTEISGYTLAEMQGKNPRILKSGATAPGVYREMWATITAGREWHGELCNRAKSGELFWEHASISAVVDDNGCVTHFVAVKENITERRRLEEQLRRAQRMEAIGALSSGIAHDLNNILTPVLLAPALLRKTIHGEHERQVLAMIEQSAHRGAEIIRQLLTFSRGSGGERVPVQLRHLLKEMCDIVVETFPREVALQMDVASPLSPVLGDATQLHQVLLNLCLNARDAMPAGGTLTLRAENIMLDAGQVRRRLEAKTGPYIVIAVQDTGQGIPPKIIERIFDPFFTTKGPGKGTGLGLSTALGIVRSHGGFLEVESEPDKGSTFWVYLPAAPPEQTVPPREMIADPPRGQSELILVVDDESSILAATRLVLEGHGYRTLIASRGEEALGLFRLRATEISLVLTDIMMPVMDGVALIRELRNIRPDVKVLVTTGMASDSKQAELAALGIAESLPKPCDRRELLKAVQGALAH